MGRIAPFDVLVLGGGGVLGEAWMTAALAGVHEAGGPDARASGCFIGTSAGSVVGAGLAGGVAPHNRLERLGREPARARTPPAAAPSAVA
jgi:NTE family protein